VSIAEELGVTADIVNYNKNPPSETTLRWIIDHLEDPITNLVRRDAVFAKLGLTDDDVANADQIIGVLTKTPKLLQRPVVVHGDTAIIGRPKDRIRKLLSEGVR
jgi:arsenate reductase (glutaredoxin)